MNRFRRFWTTLRITLPLAAVALGAVVLVACGGSSSTPTPAPAAATQASAAAATQAAAAAAPAAAASRMYIYADTVIGSKGMSADEKPLNSCTQHSRFQPGQQLGWRIKVYDAATGKQLNTDDDGVTVQIKLGDGQVFDTKFAAHGGANPTDSFFAYFWVIPTDYPTGLLPYTITATGKDGQTATFASDNMNIASSQLTIQGPPVEPAATPTSG